MWGAEIRVYVYVDGFNFYYGALKGTPYRWINLVELAKLLVPANFTIEKLKYFSARVSGAADPDAPKRQQSYLAALRTLPEVQIIFGSFLAKTIWRPIVNLPVAGATIGPLPQIPAASYTVTGGTLKAPSELVVGEYPAKGQGRKRRKPTAPPANALVAEVHTMEEKGSDVNLAAHLLNDAWKGLFDAALVFSNDSDLVEPIRMVSVERNKPVTIVCPARTPMTSKLANVSKFHRFVHPAMLAATQFPNSIPGTTISKPNSW
jgi:NYN domain